MAYYLFLDDERHPDLHGLDPSLFLGARDAPDIECIIARDYEQFCQTVDQRGLPQFVSFDHDIGPGPNGMACAHYLVNRCMDLDADPPQWRVHSKNGPGAQNIHLLLVGYARFRAPATAPRARSP